MNSKTVRPTKKQRELLDFIQAFINEHGYSPSYREIMEGLQYNSVATVALHVNNLIRRGHLLKRDHSARSLEVVASSEAEEPTEKPNQWFISKIESALAAAKVEPNQKAIDDVKTLVEALRVLGFVTEADSYQEKIKEFDNQQP